VQDPSSRTNLGEALSWCLDLMREGETAAGIRTRVRIGDERTLLSVPGVHLLTGHVGKGQQFDWVVVIGAEDGCIPDFRADTRATLAEESRILSVMVSRARHGVIVTHAKAVPSQKGRLLRKDPSRYWSTLAKGGLADASGINAWCDVVDWSAIATR
jgi:DNA helicase-2/ATP-dependent DNA helicase PcrA